MTELRCKQINSEGLETYAYEFASITSFEHRVASFHKKSKGREEFEKPACNEHK